MTARVEWVQCQAELRKWEMLEFCRADEQRGVRSHMEGYKFKMQSGKGRLTDIRVGGDFDEKR